MAAVDHATLSLLQVSYVLDTEDIFKRVKAGQAPRSGQISSIRASRFHSWLDLRREQQRQQRDAVLHNPLLEATAA